MSYHIYFQSQRSVSHSLNFRIFVRSILFILALQWNQVTMPAFRMQWDLTVFLSLLLDAQNKMTSSFITFFCQVTLPRDLIMDSGETGEEQSSCKPERICRIGQICAFSPFSMSVQSCPSRWHYDYHQRGHLVSPTTLCCLSSDLIVPEANL